MFPIYDQDYILSTFFFIYKKIYLKMMVNELLIHDSPVNLSRNMNTLSLYHVRRTYFCKVSIGTKCHFTSDLDTGSILFIQIEYCVSLSTFFSAFGTHMSFVSHWQIIWNPVSFGYWILVVS